MEHRPRGDLGAPEPAPQRQPNHRVCRGQEGEPRGPRQGGFQGNKHNLVTTIWKPKNLSFFSEKFEIEF